MCAPLDPTDAELVASANDTHESTLDSADSTGHTSDAGVISADPLSNSEEDAQPIEPQVSTLVSTDHPSDESNSDLQQSEEQGSDAGAYADQPPSKLFTEVVVIGGRAGRGVSGVDEKDGIEEDVSRSIADTDDEDEIGPLNESDFDTDDELTIPVRDIGVRASIIQNADGITTIALIVPAESEVENFDGVGDDGAAAEQGTDELQLESIQEYATLVSGEAASTPEIATTESPEVSTVL